ncbi:MAG: YbaB/EbfC family nucleoid-associated protein [Actinobacteria bacterium]|nr:YbaB/EbfC family nucleoid-associated protein [Actinomycetota bacterium]
MPHRHQPAQERSRSMRSPPPGAPASCLRCHSERGPAMPPAAGSRCRVPKPPSACPTLPTPPGARNCAQKSKPRCPPHSPAPSPFDSPSTPMPSIPAIVEQSPPVDRVRAPMQPRSPRSSSTASQSPNSTTPIAPPVPVSTASPRCSPVPNSSPNPTRDPPQRSPLMTDSFDINSLLSQALDMQQRMTDAQARAAETEITGRAGGGAVQITITGGMQFLDVTISPTAVDPEDIAMLEDLVLAALNDAFDQLADLQNAAMPALDLGALGGALGGLGGLGGGPSGAANGFGGFGGELPATGSDSDIS